MVWNAWLCSPVVFITERPPKTSQESKEGGFRVTLDLGETPPFAPGVGKTAGECYGAARATAWPKSATGQRDFAAGPAAWRSHSTVRSREGWERPPSRSSARPGRYEF